MSYYVGMSDDVLSIQDLADACNLTRRAVRFYVQQQLIPPPMGLGRGSHYEFRHLHQLRRVLELQEAGHSLEAIRQILAGRAAPEPAAVKPRAPVMPRIWARLTLQEGVELHYDATRHHPDPRQLLRLKRLAQRVFEEDRESDKRKRRI